MRMTTITMKVTKMTMMRVMLPRSTVESWWMLPFSGKAVETLTNPSAITREDTYDLLPNAFDVQFERQNVAYVPNYGLPQTYCPNAFRSCEELQPAEVIAQY
jgi:hypothetical protein